ncbi:MAG TPA: ABC transporter ATP-binding protein [Flavobacteriaceae bacterium]
MLKVENLSFKYDKTAVLKHISFSVKEGDHVSVIGESGSGKSTLLKLIHGELDSGHGHIYWKDVEILGPKYNLVVGYEFIKYVAQEFDLMPFTSVEDNIGKYLSNFFPKAKKERTKELIRVVELEPFAKTKVKNLSGGQKQRVALARALAKEPEILLLDEPFGHIDNFKKQSLRRSVFNYLKERNITCIVATHDKDDVLGYADNMMVLHNAKIKAINTPHELYNNPLSPVVASFFGEFNNLGPYGIVYANQLKVARNSGLKVLVKHSYFNGKNYLIEAELGSKKVYFEHHKALKKDSMVSLKVIG